MAVVVGLASLMAVVVGLGHPCGGGCRARVSLMAVVVGLGHPCGSGC